jgi:hypothetical protein
LGFEFFKDVEDGRTDGAIFVCDLWAFEEVVAIGVWIVAAVAGSYIVDAAIVVGSQEGAGREFHHIIFVAVYTEVSIYEISFFHSQVFGDPADIRSFEAGADRFAAVTALQAVDLFERFFMQLRQQLFYPFSTAGLQFCKELFVFFLFIAGFLLPVVVHCAHLTAKIGN